MYGPITQIKMVNNVVNGKPRGYAFIEYEREADMHDAFRKADCRKIDGRRVIVDVERGRTVKGWRPRRLGMLWLLRQSFLFGVGGGLGGTRRLRSRSPSQPSGAYQDNRRLGSSPGRAPRRQYQQFRGRPPRGYSDDLRGGGRYPNNRQQDSRQFTYHQGRQSPSYGRQNRRHEYAAATGQAYRRPSHNSSVGRSSHVQQHESGNEMMDTSEYRDGRLDRGYKTNRENTNRDSVGL
ncbi:hypothetical protein ACOME3_009008 [Neoechinorhynchus agilis]